MWVLIGVLTSVLMYLVLSVWPQSDKARAQERLDRLVRNRRNLEQFATVGIPDDIPEGQTDGKPQETAPQRQSVRQVLLGVVEKATTGRRFSNRLEVRLKRADWKWRPAEFLVVQGLAAALGLAIWVLSASPLGWILVPLGWFVPNILLARSEKARLKKFNHQLPDALIIIANALRSGYSFLQAVEVVNREMPDPIGTEFGQVLRENRVNIPIEESLTSLVDRVKSRDMDLVVTAVLIQRQVGGNLSEVLDKITVTIQDRVKLLGQIRTLTAQGRISGRIVSLLPLVLAVILELLSPGYLAPMFNHPVGMAMIAIGIIMEIIGIAVIRKMVDLEV